MLKTILISILGLSLAMSVSCSNKDKNAEESAVAVGDVGNDPSIAAAAMNFDPMGSDSGSINGLSSVYFEYDKAHLSADARQSLANNADWIKQHSDITVQIEGHCDNRGSVEYNLALGERRAKSVKNYLVGLGVSASQITILSYGKEKLIDMTDIDAAHSKNRRANFVPLPR